jgi:hypothetical protein
LERNSGWSFWWQWVLATNLGWFPGIALGLWAASLLPESATVARACVAAAVAAALFGGTQAFVLSGFLPRVRGWWFSTFIGWTVGVGLAELALVWVPLSLPPLAESAVVAFIAGAVVGLPQAWALMTETTRWPWWPVVSAVGWGALFPGAIPGIVLARLVRTGRETPAAQQSAAADTT